MVPARVGRAPVVGSGRQALRSILERHGDALAARVRREVRRKLERGGRTRAGGLGSVGAQPSTRSFACATESVGGDPAHRLVERRRDLTSNPLRSINIILANPWLRGCMISTVYEMEVGHAG